MDGDSTNLTFYGSLKILWETLISSHPKAQFFCITPLHRATEAKADNGVTRTLAEYVNAERIMAEKYGVEVIDLFKFGEFFAMMSGFRNLFSPDGIHPNQAWYTILGRKIAERIRK